jgi:tRNA threonylcarbamoyladenosine biosynthesis protein TsaE
VLRIETSSPEQTGHLGAVLANMAAPGDVLVLVGDLGAGKTAFSKAYGAALGVAEPMTSPTFTLAREYQGRLPLNHLDVYRLEQMSEVLDLDLPDLLDAGGVVLIEWGDAIVSTLPADFLEVRFTFGEGDDDRQIELRPVGERWCSREPAIAAGLELDVTSGDEPC